MVSLWCTYRTTLSHPHDIIDRMKVRVYYNLHKHCLSVQHMIDGRWRVCSYTNEIHLRDVTFTVSQKSRQRVIKEKRKNVHAFIIGTVVDNSDETPIRVTYNPYLYDSFVECGSNTPIHYANRAHIVGRAIGVAR